MPPSLALDDLLSRKNIAQLAQHTYREHPNLVAQLGAGKSTVDIKWFGWRSRVHYYLSPTFPGRAMTSWIIAQALLKVSARTPEALFVYSRRRRGFIQENFLVTDDITPHQTLRSFLKSGASVALKEAAVMDLALSIARMHGGGIFHRDLTTANFLVAANSEVYIVDLNRARRRRRLATRTRLLDLARLNFEATDPDLEARLTQLFFEVYGRETTLASDWEAGYHRYREKLIGQRRRKARLRGLASGK